MTILNRYYASKIYDECAEAVKDFLSRFIDGGVSAINALDAGLCINLDNSLPYYYVPERLSYGLVNTLALSWVSEYNSGEEAYPIKGGEKVYLKLLKKGGSDLYEGDQLAARLDLAKHLLEHCDSYFESERYRTIGDLIHRIKYSPRPTLKRTI